MSVNKDKIDNFVFTNPVGSSLSDEEVTGLADKACSSIDDKNENATVVIDKRQFVILVASYLEHEGSK